MSTSSGHLLRQKPNHQAAAYHTSLAGGSRPVNGRASGSPPVNGRASGSPPVNGRASGSPPVNGRASDSSPVNGRAIGSPPVNGRAIGSPPVNGRASGSRPVNGRASVRISGATQTPFELDTARETCIEAQPFTLEEARPPRLPSLLTLYVREVGQVKRLSREEEITLARRVQRGDQAAREQMIKSNLPLVMTIAHGFEHMGLPLLDLISEGNLGLMKAVERFNPARGTRLSTYAAIWIKAHICRALSNHARTIRIPENVLRCLHLIDAATQRLHELLGREPTDDEIAEQIGLLSANVRRMRAAIRATVSLDDTHNDPRSRSMAETVADHNSLTPYEALAHSFNLEQLQQLRDTLGQLSLRERTVLQSRFGLDGEDEKTLGQIARRFGLTRERVRQIQNLALARLRKKINQLNAVRLATQCGAAGAPNGTWPAAIAKS